MSEEEYQRENDGFTYRASPYDWKLGVAVQITIFKGPKKIGAVRLLSARHEEKFHIVEALPTSELLQKATEGFVSLKTKTNTAKVMWWQEQIDEMGHDFVSPVYADLSACF